jgi:hypothetical protein
MTTIPDFMPQLIGGKGKNPKSGGCILQVCDFLDRGAWTDETPCVHPALRKIAIAVNDGTDDAGRRELYRLVPRLMGTNDGEKRTSVGLAVWCARRVLHLVRPQDRAVCEAAIVASEDWLAGTGTAAANAAAYAAAYAAYAAAYAAYAAAYAAYAANAAAYAAANAAAYAANAAKRELRFGVADLTAMLDEFDRLTGRSETPAVSEVEWRRVAAAMAG